MKKTLLLSLFLSQVLFCFAQGGINYKALIKDTNGDILTNENITIQFTIQQSNGSGVYRETHTPTTDENGLIAVNIGQGIPLFSSFSNIDWQGIEYFLNVKIDTGNGLTDLGTTPFKNVPYAFYAEKAGNISGLEVISEGNNNGWRLADRNPSFYGDIGNFAVDLSISLLASNVAGATGQASFAGGSQTQASGNSSTAFGFETRAESFAGTALGVYNTGGGNPTAIAPTNPIFEVGNGFSPTDRRNALTVFYSGVITAPSLSIFEITDDKSLITKEYLEAAETKGLEQITEGGNTGFRLVGKNPAQFGNIGQDAVDISSSFNTTDRGATGNQSFAVGTSTRSSGSSSAAFGFNSEASGNVSAAFGYGSKADGLGTMAVGNYNIGGGVAANFTPTNPVFEVGCGTNDQARKNALTVLQNGKVGIGRHTGMEGMLEIEGNSTGTEPQLALIEDNSGFARFRFKNTNRNGDDYWDIAGFIGTNIADDRLNFFNSLGGNIMSLTGDGDVFVNGSLAHSSDRRLKRDIETLEYGIAEILKLNPVQYHWKNKEEKPHKSLGVIAQEIQEVIPNVVQVGDDVNQTLSVSYTELIPVLIKALQEQQAIIETQNKKINTLTVELAELSTINKRVAALEKWLKNTPSPTQNSQVK